MKKRMVMGLLFLLLPFSVSGCGNDSMLAETMQEVEAKEAETSIDKEEESDRADEAEYEIEEAVREELITQLLEENDLDTSIVNNTKATGGCIFTLPEGFAEAEDMPGMYVTGHYPVDASTIYYAELEKDISLQLMTKDTFVENMQSTYRQIYDTEIEINLESFEEMKIDGYPAFRVLCSYTVDDVGITQLEYIINADKSYVITYSQTDEYDRMEAYEASAATIQLKSGRGSSDAP